MVAARRTVFGQRADHRSCGRHARRRCLAARRLRGDLARFNDLVDLHDGHLRRLGEAGPEMLVGAAELHIAEAVGPVPRDERVVDGQRRLQQVGLAVEVPHLLAVGDRGVQARRGVESREASASGPQALHQGALRDQFEGHLPFPDHFLRRGRTARSRRKRDNQVPDASGLNQSLGAGRNRVADKTQIPRAALVQRGEQAEKVRRDLPGRSRRRRSTLRRASVADCVGRRGTQLVHVPSLRPQHHSD